MAPHTTATATATEKLWRHVFGEGAGYLAIFSGVRKKPGDKELTYREQRFFDYPQELNKALSYTASKASERGREVYFCTHLLRAKNRSKPNAAPVSCLYADADGHGLPDLAKELATAIVETSPGRFHVYVRLTHPLPPPEAEHLNKRLALAMGADPSGADTSQVLRVPGSRSHKYADKPTVTLRRLKNSAAVDPAELDRALPELPPEAPDVGRATPKTAPAPIGETDVELLDRARNARNGAEFRKLYDQGDTSGHDHDHSRADFELCRMLAFWTAWDAERVERMFTASALGQRDKWRRRADYRATTIERAIAATPRAYRQSADTDPKLIAALETLRARAESLAWEGRGGPTERHLYDALVRLAAKHGGLKKSGVVVGVDMRNLALAAGVGLPTASRGLDRLERDRKLIRRARRGKGTRGSTYLLKLPHKPPAQALNIKTCVVECSTLSGLRNPAPTPRHDFDKHGRRLPVGKRFLLHRLGKLAALVIERVSAAPDGTSVEDVAHSLGRRARNLRRKVAQLLEAGLLVESGGLLGIPEDFERRLEVELEESGCNDAQRRDAKNYADQRERHRAHLGLPPPDHAPTREDMDAIREDMVRMAFEAFCHDGSGPQMIAHTYADGGTSDFTYVIRAVVHYVTKGRSTEGWLWADAVERAYALYVGRVRS